MSLPTLSLTQNEVRKQVRTETQPHAVTFASG